MKEFRPLDTRVLIVAAIGLAALLAASGFLQYRWLDLASARERELMQADLERILENIRFDADREINRFCLLVMTTRTAEHSNLADDLTKAMEGWQAETEWPHLVDAVFWTQRRVPKPKRPEELPLSHYTLRRWNPAGHRWELETLKPVPDSVYFSHETLPLITVESGSPPMAQVLFYDGSDRGFGPYIDEFATGRAQEPDRESCLPNALWQPCESAPPPTGLLWIRDEVSAHLDSSQLRSEILPHLIQKHFGTGRLDYRVELRNDYTGLTYDMSNPKAPGAKGPPYTSDAEVPILTVRLADFKFLIGLVGDGFSWTNQLATQRQNSSAWRLQATHLLGSLDAAVEQRRHRNLAVAFGILTLLAGGIAVMIISAIRARRLGR